MGFGNIGVGFGSIGVGFGFRADGGGNIAVGFVGSPAAGDTGEAEGVGELWGVAVANEALAACCFLSCSFWNKKRQPTPKNRVQKMICLITGGHEPPQSGQTAPATHEAKPRSYRLSGEGCGNDESLPYIILSAPHRDAATAGGRPRAIK